VQKVKIEDIRAPLDYHYTRIISGVKVRGRIDVRRVYLKRGRWWVKGPDHKLGRYITLQPGQIDRPAVTKKMR
jgi:hypothetical protein